MLTFWKCTKNRFEGTCNILIKRHLVDHDTKFQQYFRLTPYLFDRVLTFVKNDLIKCKTNANRRPISPEEQLCIGLRFLATGETYRSLSFQFRVSFSYVSLIVQPVLMPVAVPTQDKWKEIASYNFRRWNYPNCIGSLDGKHIRIKCPGKSGSLYYNYKGFFSIILLAISDGQMRFVAVDIGAYEREGDSGVLKSTFGKKILSGECNVPAPTEIPGTDVVAPHVFLGDSAFPLLPNLMRPYPHSQANQNVDKALFNYR